MLTPEQIDRLVQGQEDDPFAALGVHPDGAGFSARLLMPDAVAVKARTLSGESVGDLESIHPAGLFAGPVSIAERQALRYDVTFGDGSTYSLIDPYGFGPVLGPVSYTHLTLPTKRIV